MRNADCGISNSLMPDCGLRSERIFQFAIRNPQLRKAGHAFGFAIKDVENRVQLGDYHQILDA